MRARIRIIAALVKCHVACWVGFVYCGGVQELVLSSSRCHSHRHSLLAFPAEPTVALDDPLHRLDPERVLLPAQG